MRSTDDIVSLYETRKRNRAPVFEQMAQVKAAYNAELALPLPELDRNEKAAVANLLAQGIDGTAQRITSTMPDIHYPPIRPGIKRSEDQARIRRQANFGWWERNDMPLLLARRARHLVGYATSPVVLRPDKNLRHARWEVRDPLTCYPAPTARLDSVEPDDVIFTFTRTLGWLNRNYPGPAMVIEKAKATPDEKFTICEYVDADEMVLVVIGRPADPYDWQQSSGLAYAELDRAPNRSGLCPAVVPGRVTLDRIKGQFDGLIPMYYKQAKLDALEYIAIEQGVWPRTWLVGNPGETPKVISMADGRKGIVGIVSGGSIHEENLNPGYKTTEAIDRLAGEQRIEGNVPPEMQGQSSTNIRTGRRGDQVLANGIDYGIQEAQRLLQASLQAENRRAVAITKAWFGTEKHSFYVSWRSAQGNVDYIPNDVFNTDHNVVKYSLAGTDLNGLVVRTGQKVGARLISLETARKQDPEIDDADFESHQIVVEQVETAFLQGFSQQLASGSVTLIDAANFLKKVKLQRMDPVEAFEQVQAEAQARQATSGEPGTPEGPVPPGSPEAQPGVAPPGQGAEAGVAIPPPAPGQHNLAEILANAGQAARMARSA